jgi:hypothetical protein
MSPFGIFTVVLVILYVVYYSIQIFRDVYGKQSNSKTFGEEFDVSSLGDDEESIGVQESSDGFHFGSEPVGHEAADPAPIVDESATEKLVEEVQEEMEIIDPHGSATMSKEFFKELLLEADKEGSLFLDTLQVQPA